jgi:L-fuculose-phosphate aldolase|tara:strand:- start:351 stop:1070 length:720 start_codon:yes stop_codon:yes gene_type:complete
MTSTTEPEIRYQVALAGRILDFLGQSDAILGFVGARAADGASFWMKQMPMGLDEVNPGDLLRLDYEGNVVEGEGRKHNEWVLFAAMFRDHSEMAAAVHTHAPYCLAVAAQGKSIEPFDQFGTYFYANGVPLFEETPDRVYTFELAEAILDRMGDCPASIITYHGILTHGASVREACMRAVYLEKAAQTQLLAYQGGAARPLDDVLARKLGLNAPYDLLYEFSWNYYERQIRKKSPDFGA